MDKTTDKLKSNDSLLNQAERKRIELERNFLDQNLNIVPKVRKKMNNQQAK